MDQRDTETIHLALELTSRTNDWRRLFLGLELVRAHGTDRNTDWIQKYSSIWTRDV